MAALRVIADDILDPGAGERSVLAEQWLRALIATKPRGMRVAAVVSASPEGDYARLRDLLPGLDGIHKSALARRELHAAWAHGFTPLAGDGFVHATSPLAPLRRHDRSIDPESQTVVTVHRATAWTDPDLLDARTLRRELQLVKRAVRYADAIVAPTHTVAALVTERYDVGDRVRVIGAGAGIGGTSPTPGDERAAGAVVAVAGDSRADGLDALLEAFDSPALADRRLVVVRTSADRTLPHDAEAALGERLLVLDSADAAQLHALVGGAAVVAAPHLSDGPGLAVLSGFSAGVPVVHSDEPSLHEIAADSGIEVSRGDGYSDRLADAIASAFDDTDERARLSVMGHDRAKAFTWRDAAEKIWQLHADL
jgi:glycosyltransferase involved in cell wall biosynthesis